MTKLLDEDYKTIRDAIGAVQAVRQLATEAERLRAEIERLHQTWVRGDLTQTDFDKAFRETEQ